MWRFFIVLFFIPVSLWADTIDHYMNIANNIPKMEMKADQQSQAWARSARNILILTSESIVESLLLANQAAGEHGAPLFCPPQGAKLDAESINNLIQKTYQESSSQFSDKNRMTVSQVALLGLKKQYPCENQSNNTLPKQMEHVSARSESGLSALGMTD